MFQSRNAVMTDIDLNQMEFSCGGQQAVIAFDPPMKTLREARERLVQMDKDSLQVLGQSDIAITTFVPPYVKIPHLINFSQCFAAYALLPRPANFEPGSLLYESVLFRVPSFAAFVARISLPVLFVMLLIHIFETVLMARKLATHGLTPFDIIWWKWMGTCFVEGITSFWRLDGHIEEKRKEKEAKKH